MESRSVIQDSWSWTNLETGVVNMGNVSDIARDAFMLDGKLSECGYDWWWHSFTGHEQNTGEEKSFFIEFFTCNPGLGGDEPILGQLPENQKEDVKPSYLMVKVGAWGEDAVQLHKFYGWNEVEMGSGVPFSVTAGVQKDGQQGSVVVPNAGELCRLSETETSGEVVVTPEDAAAHPEWMCGSGSMKWKLKIDKKVAFNVGYGAGERMRERAAFEMFWHAEGMKTEYEGEVILNGKTYVVDPQTSYGYADKNWGKDFTSPWVWLSSNNLTSKKTGKKLENSVFNIGGGRPKIRHLALNRKLLSDFYYEGTDYEFNFSKFWTLTETAFDCHETETQIIWHVDQKTPLHRMVTDITCEKKDMLLINYEAPDGAKRHNRLWNGGNGVGIVKLYRRHPHGEELIDEVEAMNVGCEYGEYC